MPRRPLALPGSALCAATIASCAIALQGAPVAAAPPPLDGVPRDRDRVGDAFVEAWLSLRRDIDTLSHGGVHPALLDAWTSAMPRWLSRDVAKLATEPQVVLAAGRSLARGAGDADRAILADLEREMEESALANAFRALRLAAGDRAALRGALADLEDQRPGVRVEAAAALAAAGDRRGLRALAEMAASSDEEAFSAARYLGRYGGERERRAIAEELARYPDRNALAAAEAEIALREHLPWHYSMLLRRDPTGQRLSSAGGLYDTWLDALGRAFRAGSRSSSAVISFVEANTREIAPGEQGEVTRRRLKALVEFWTAVEGELLATGPRPDWPESFDEALGRIEDGGVDGPEGLDSRVSAAISLCASCASRLDHGGLADPGGGVAILTAGGGRAADGSLATSWHAGPGGRLVLERRGSSALEGLWVANSCAAEAGARISRVRVSGSGSGRPWETEAHLGSETRYFQRLSLDGRRASRLEITVLEISGGKAACIAEIRAF